MSEEPRQPTEPYRTVLSRVAARQAKGLHAPAPAEAPGVATGQPEKPGGNGTGRTLEGQAAEIVKRIDATCMAYDQYLAQGVIIPAPRDVAALMKDKRAIEDALAKKEEVEDLSVYYDIGQQVAAKGGGVKELIDAVREHLSTVAIEMAGSAKRVRKVRSDTRAA